MMDVADQDGVEKAKGSRSWGKVSRTTSRTNINPHLNAFLQNTSLHGVKYIGNGNIHWKERLFWWSVLIACSISLVTVSRMKWFQWRQAPITIERANAPHHISTLPIPAITYCGVSIFDRTVLTHQYIRNETEMHFVRQLEKLRWLLQFRELLESYMKIYPDTVDSVYKLVDIVNDGPFNHFFKINNTQNSIGTKFKIATSRFKDIMSGFGSPFAYKIFGIHHKTALETYCSQTFTSKGFCTSCNIFPPPKLYKNTTVHHSMYHPIIYPEWMLNRQSLINTYEYTNDTIHGFPLLNVVDYEVSHKGGTSKLYNVTRRYQYPIKVGDFERWDSMDVAGDVKENINIELRIVFRDDFFYPRIRTYAYNKFDIIETAIFYLDIFLGISMLTIVEIFYYLGLYVVDCFKR
ncbi:hypothetical protein LSTR_LSTR015591 [Laodelphax striatellus]|uniref:Uncharacterized protein n=1 Tax=Laodelphax striatellus TaxID=195883 RepID=A0A482XEQ3_LAOST|nr:hypothetical protein LSTR_LSTR015591 [Laodelphax striatellus]